VIDSGVRSSWDALAANRCWCATCASSRASMVSKLSASSRNSSCRPSKAIRGERPARGDARGVGDASQGGEHTAGQKPPSQQTKHQQERHHGDRDRSEIAEQVGVALNHEDHTGMHTTRKGEVPGDEQHGTCEHDNAGIAEREFEANAETGASIDVLLAHGPVSG